MYHGQAASGRSGCGVGLAGDVQIVAASRAFTPNITSMYRFVRPARADGAPVRAVAFHDGQVQRTEHNQAWRSAPAGAEMRQPYCPLWVISAALRADAQK